MSNIMEWKKIRKNSDDPEILHYRQMERHTKPNLKRTSAGVCVQLVFAPRKCYRLSVAIWWYILVKFLVKLFISQDLPDTRGNYS